MSPRSLLAALLCLSLTQGAVNAAAQSSGQPVPDGVPDIMQRIRDFEFNPIVKGFTKEPALQADGVADLDDQAWRVRTLTIRDLARLGEAAIPELIAALNDQNEHVRHVAAFVLGLRHSDKAEDALMQSLKTEKDLVVRSQLIISLGQLNSKKALPILKDLAQNDSNRDTRHQADLAVDRISKDIGLELDLAQKFASLDEASFETVQVGKPAPDFELTDTSGKTWRLSDFRGKKDVALIWIFADWCPVCHNEFRELIQLKEEYEADDIQVFTIECHDPYRARVMVGEEFQPDYWFTKVSPQGFYEGKIWWPHLVDIAAKVGLAYGVHPMQFTVHSEWINRPTTVIVDKEGIVRFLYQGTYWGDRPSIEQTREMIVADSYDFEHPKRLKP